MNNNSISVCFTPELFYKYSDVNAIVVIVDILRATTVISTAFYEGVKSIIPVTNIEEALLYKNKRDYIVAAERDGKCVSWFDFSNSPFDYIDNNDINDSIPA